MIVAIWFVAGTTQLRVRVATSANVNDGIESSTASLPLNATTNVRLEALGRVVLLYLNNSYDSMVTVSADRIFGAATLSISDTWSPSASAHIGSIQMKSKMRKPPFHQILLYHLTLNQSEYLLTGRISYI